MPDTQTRKRKRVSESRSEDSDDSKKRGRPRVEKKDESAADVSNEAGTGEIVLLFPVHPPRTTDKFWRNRNSGLNADHAYSVAEPRSEWLSELTGSAKRAPWKSFEGECLSSPILQSA